MFPPEILKKVKLIELSTRKIVNNLFAGEYHTAFKGQGMMFKDFREYVPGDDVRAISWALTARTGKTFVKNFEEERELTLLLAVDISGSNDFGSTKNFKGEVMSWVAGLMAFAAIKNKDQVGLLLFSDQVEHFVPPKKGQGHVQRMLRDLFYIKPKRTGTSVASAVQFLQGFLKKRSVVLLISDFQDKNFGQALRHLGQRHDVIACWIKDPAEENFPDLGLVDLQDPETGEIVTVDSGSSSFRRHYKQQQDKQRTELEQELRKSQVDLVPIDTQEDFLNPLIKFFQKRRR